MSEIVEIIDTLESRLKKVLQKMDHLEQSSSALQQELNKATATIQRQSEEIDADSNQTPVSMDVYYIVSDKCTECVGFHDEPQCAAVCPVDCCVDDPDHRETKEQLLAKKEFMHL